jgi:glyoxylase-like metal-dependent hydrolase (beta-lactamase superfamily II)
MASFTALSQGIYCIDALYVKPGVASIYLLQQADEVAIIETGTFHSMENVLATLAELGIAHSQVKYVIPTHVHLDHAGGAGAMMQQFEQAKLIIHPRGARHMTDPERLIAGTVAVYGQQLFDRLYGRIDAIAEDRVIVAQDLDRHTSNGVFTGDTFGICYDPMKQFPRGLLPSCPPTQFDPPALHRSIGRIMDFAPDRLYLTHYGELQNPAAQLSSFASWIDAYVELCNDRMSQHDDEQALQDSLMRMVLDAMPAGSDEAEIVRILQADIGLNAQGLAHWWRQGHA